MKKIFVVFTVFSATVLALSGCLKDKGFDNHQYGINDPDTQPPGVGFPRAASAKYTAGIVRQVDPQVITNVVFVNLESGKAASSDVHITLQLNDELRTAYNAANGTTIVPFDPSLFNVPLSITIPAGQRTGTVDINIPDASTLDPNLTFGIGFTITAVDGGYKIADNLKNLFVEVAVKNKYDGAYELKGVHNRNPYIYPFDVDVEMWTTGPNSVALYVPDDGDFEQPIGVAPGQWSSYGNAVSPNFAFDPATDLCTGVTLQVGSAVTLAMVTTGGIVNRYDPATKTMYLVYQYNGNDLRRFYDTLIYKGPR